MASRAIVVTDVNDPQKWKIVNKEKPRASPGHVVVHITLRPVNPTDVLSLRLFMSDLTGREDRDVVTGSEGVGYVEEIGKGVTKVKVGQRVVPSFMHLYYHHGNGSWQDYVEVPEDELHFVPDSVSDEVAAQAIVNPWTVYGMLDELKVPRGDYVLQNAAGSVLGRQVIQLAKKWGIKTINMVRRDEVGRELKALGADEVINSTSEDVVKRVKEITGGKGAYGAFDAVAGVETKIMAASVKDGGILFIYGVLASPDFDATMNLVDYGRVNASFFAGNIRWWGKTNEQLQEMSTTVGKLLEEKTLNPSTGKIYKFEDFKQAAQDAGKGPKVLIGT